MLLTSGLISGGGIPIGGGGGGTEFPRPRGVISSISSSARKSVKSKSHSVNGRVIFLTSSSQCNSFSDFFGSGFLISLLGDLKMHSTNRLAAEETIWFSIFIACLP